MTLDKVETALKIVALVAAAAFFLWKLFTGWLIVNLALQVTEIRQVKNERVDFLAISILLDKGTTDSVWLKHVSVRVTPEGQSPLPPISLTGYRRLNTVGDKLDWSAEDTTQDKWAVSPGEKLQLGAWCEVPTGIPARIEVAVLGTRPFWTPGFQWRATTVSLPRPTEKPTSE